MNRRARVWLLRGALVVAATAFSVVTVEAALHLLPEPLVGGAYWGSGAFVAFEQTGYRHAPGFVGRAMRGRELDCRVAIDELGLRHGELGRPREPEPLLVLGDSFPFGLGVDERETLPALLDEALSPGGVGVINGGQTGYCPTQSLALGRWLLPQIEPAAVLLTVFLSNDLEGEYFSEWRAIDVVRGFRLPIDRRPKGALWDWIRTRTRLGLIAQNRLRRAAQRGRRAEFRAARDQSLEAVVERAVEPIVAFAEECSGRHIGFGVVMIPPRGRATDYDAAFLRRLYEGGIPVLDLAGRLGREHYYARDGHWNAAGHAAAAALVAPFARTLLAPERSSGQLRSGAVAVPTAPAAAR